MADTLLLADDEAGITALMRQYFEAAGYRVVCASSGREALERLSCRPDLILLDISMPDVDGLEVCRRIRSHVSCPILFLTARIERRTRYWAFRPGATITLSSPSTWMSWAPGWPPTCAGSAGGLGAPPCAASER